MRYIASQILAASVLVAGAGAGVGEPATAPSEAPGPATQPETVDRIVARVRELYGSCKSFEDDGVVETIDLLEGQSSERHPFSVRFIRDGKFEYRVRSVLEGFDDDSEYWLVADNGQVRFEREGWAIELPDIRTGLVRALAVSAGNSAAVPGLLWEESSDVCVFSDDREFSLVGEEVINGVQCWRLEAKEGRSTRTVHVGRADHLVYRVEYRLETKSRKWTNIATHRPRLVPGDK